MCSFRLGVIGYFLLDTLDDKNRQSDIISEHKNETLYGYTLYSFPKQKKKQYHHLNVFEKI